MIKICCLSLVIGLCFLSMGCNKADDPAFEVNYDVDFTIPAGLNNIETHFFTRTAPTLINTRLDDLGLTWDDIERVNAGRGLITAKFTEVDWDFVQSVKIDAINITKPDERKEIFYKDFVDFDTNDELRLFSSLPDLKNLLINDNVLLEIQLKFRRFVPANIEARFTYSFNVYEVPK